ncbi:MAG: glycosyltransferase family 4 protein [Candidatus Baltobacteraceae bacterium]
MSSAVAILSFEGPDRYSLVGGLGTRVTELAGALAEAGHSTDLFFVGDPTLSSLEERGPNLRYRRWCQWISAHHPANVYDGEAGKVNDLTASLPPFLLATLVAPAAQRGERVLVLAEEWQTAAATIALDRLLRTRGLRWAATILWNANNTYGFDDLDWPALRAAATITTVSKYMKFELALHGIEALVIPNGIPERLLAGPPAPLVHEWRRALDGRPLLVKVGRFDRDKRWMQAIDAVAELHAAGYGARLVVRGGRESYGEEVFDRARARGLRVGSVAASSAEPDELFARLAQSTDDVINLRAFLEPEMLYAMYAAADAVLANSGKEPFGLVGLEVMAAGGLAVCGATGEEYAEPFVNAIVCDTEDGRELAAYLRGATADAETSEAMRLAGRARAARSTWATVIEVLERKLPFIEETQRA